MAKKLTMTFGLEGNDTMDVSIAKPKEGMDLAAVKTAAADLIPVLEGTGGAAVLALNSAKYITTTVDELA